MDEYRQEALSCCWAAVVSPSLPVPVRGARRRMAWQPDGILEFASVEAARAWYVSPDDQAIIGKRHAAATSNAIILAGFEMPEG